jgi:nucleoside 2-deoxyribosyltransferase
MAKPSYAFFAVPFLGDTAALRDAVNIATQHAGLQLLRPDQVLAPSRTVLEDLQISIDRSSLVIGETSEANANVMWELGFAQARQKPIVLLTQDPGTVPFDLHSARVVTYQRGAPFESLIARLTDAISETLNASGSDQPEPTSTKRHRVFFSYSHADAAYLDRILVHFATCRTIRSDQSVV